MRDINAINGIFSGQIRSPQNSIDKTNYKQFVNHIDYHVDLITILVCLDLSKTTTNFILEKNLDDVINTIAADFRSEYNAFPASFRADWENRPSERGLIFVLDLPSIGQNTRPTSLTKQQIRSFVGSRFFAYVKCQKAYLTIRGNLVLNYTDTIRQPKSGSTFTYRRQEGASFNSYQMAIAQCCIGVEFNSSDDFYQSRSEAVYWDLTAGSFTD